MFDGLLSHIPQWLADATIRFVDASTSTPTAVSCRVGRYPENAFLVTDGPAGRPLGRVAHRVTSLDEGIDRLEAEDDADPARLARRQRRLADKRAVFEQRGDLPALDEAWVPISRIDFVGRRSRTRAP